MSFVQCLSRFVVALRPFPFASRYCKHRPASYITATTKPHFNRGCLRFSASAARARCSASTSVSAAPAVVITPAQSPQNACPTCKRALDRFLLLKGSTMHCCDSPSSSPDQMTRYRLHETERCKALFAYAMGGGLAAVMCSSQVQQTSSWHNNVLLGS